MTISVVRRNQIIIWLVGLVTIGVTLLPLSHPQFFRVHDYTHGARIIEMFRGLQDGQVPVRWSQNFGYGYGMPTFLFYGPFPYVIGAAAYWLTRDLVWALKVIWAIPSILSFIGMYRLTRKYFGRLGALVAAVSFTLAPYRAVDLYVRGAVGEVWGISFFPWLLMAADEWFKKPRWVSVKLSVLIGLLFITHNLMAMFFIPVLAVYGVLKWFFQEKRTVATLVQFLVQLVVGFGLAAFFILPALLEKGHTQIEQRILSGYFSYTQHFLYIRQFFQENWKYGGSVWGPNDDLSFFLGYGQLAGLLAFAGAFVAWMVRVFIRRKQKFAHFFQKLPTEYRELLPIVTLALLFLPISLFFTLTRSEPLWKLSTLLQTAQFPWRFLSLAIFCLAIVNGVVLRLYLQRNIRFVLFGGLFLLLLVPAFKYFQPEKFLDEAKAFYYTDPHRIRFEMSETWPDFLPREFISELPPTDERFQTPPGLKDSEFNVTVDRSSELFMQVRLDIPIEMLLNIAQFPGWTVYIDGNPIETTTLDGLVQIQVPEGSHTIAAKLERTPARAVADMITVLSLSLVLAQMIIIRKKTVHHE